MNITGKTKTFGVIADPIDHVRAPEVFNALFRARGIDAVLIPIHVRPSELASMFNGFRAWGNLGGFCVTIPHKEPMLDLCDDCEPAARIVGAANVVRHTETGRLIGGNFDGDGFVAGMREQGFKLTDQRVLLIGAGGAAKAIAYALVQASVAEINIANRTSARAHALKDNIQTHCVGAPISVGAPDPRGYDLVINTTSLGLHRDDQLPLDPDRLEPSTVVADIIMKPEETRLLAAARAQGCKVQYGRHMLDAQIPLLGAFMGAIEQE